MHYHSSLAARLSLAVFAVFLYGGITARAAVIYRETFGIDPSATADQFATVFDWQRFDNFGQPITTTGTASGVNFSANGRPIDVSNVNAGPNNDGTFGPYVRGILYLGATPTPSVALTTEYTVDPASYIPGSIVFSFYEGNNTAPQFFKLLIRVDGDWYASATNFASPAVSLANFGAQAQFKSLSYNPAASNWLLVNFDGDYVKGETPGTGETTPSSLGDLTLGVAPATDLTGPITGFGVYGESGGGTGNRRLDSFTIEATPLVVAANKTVTWVGNVSADWDTATANWRTNTPPGAATFADGDIVLFSDSSAVGEVNLVPLLMPATVTISNETVNYKFSGGGGIGGSAVLIKNGIGQLTLSNNNSFTGGVYLQQGSIHIGDGGASGSIGTGNFTNNGLLTVNRTGTVVLSNAISGSGSLFKELEGTLVLGGSNTYSGNTYIGGGTLLLNGLNAGAGFLTNAPGSTISGSGTNAGFVNVGGILSPGDGIGTFTAGGLELWSTNVMDIGAVNTPGGGVNDLIVVNGGLTLHNTTLIVNVPETPATGVPYRLINYTGTRVGTFGAVVIIGVDRYPATVSYDDTAKAVNLTFTPPPVQPVIIYRETFGIAPGATVDLNAKDFDWERFDAQGFPVTTTGSSSGVNFTVNGRPANVANVNAGPNNDGTSGAYANGILYFAATPSPSIGFTTEFVVNPTNYVAGSILFSWYEGNNTDPHLFRVLVRVGGLWYATDAIFTSPAVSLANFGTQAQLRSFGYNPAASNWWRVNFDGDFVLGDDPGLGIATASTLGDIFLIEQPATDLAGSITAFGFYGENGGTGTGNRRVDSFTIEAAPAPTTAKPRISNIQTTSDNVLLTVISGPPGWNVRVLSSTDIATPVSGWTAVETGTFDGSGNFSATLPNAKDPQRFYLLQSP